MCRKYVKYSGLEDALTWSTKGDRGCQSICVYMVKETLSQSFEFIRKIPKSENKSSITVSEVWLGDVIRPVRLEWRVLVKKQIRAEDRTAEH